MPQDEDEAVLARAEMELRRARETKNEEKRRAHYIAAGVHFDAYYRVRKGVGGGGDLRQSVASSRSDDQLIRVTPPAPPRWLPSPSRS